MQSLLDFIQLIKNGYGSAAVWKCKEKMVKSVFNIMCKVRTVLSADCDSWQGEEEPPLVVRTGDQGPMHL